MQTSETIVKRPVFIIGTGRSGTTLMFKTLHRHPDFAWPCQYMVGKWLTSRDRWINKLATLPIINIFIKEKHFRRRYVAEPFDLWKKFDLGFNRPIRDLTAQDCNESTINGMRNALYQQQERMSKNRFLTKYTGWSRIDYVSKIFPDAQFLHVIRDGRAVAWSLMQQEWWLGWQGPSQWRWGKLSPEHNDIWEQSDRSFFILAGLQWKILMDNICKKGDKIGDRYKKVKYEQFINDPEKIIRDFINWADIRSFSSFIIDCQNIKLYNSNVKWKNEVKKSEIDKFNKFFGPMLEKYGYR